MRLPSHVLATLLAAGACEHALRVEETCKSDPIVAETDSTPLDEVVRTSNYRPAVAPIPNVVPPPPPHLPSQLQPQPVVKPKPKPRMVWESICGHAPQLLDAQAALKRCGKG